MIPTYWLIFFLCGLLILTLLFLANCLKIFFPKYNLGFLVILLWSAVISYFFLPDYFEIRPLFALAVFAIMIVCFVSIIIIKKRPEFLQLFTYTNLRHNAMLFCIWGVSLIFIILPLAISLPNNTVVSGHFISNDSVMHALMADGYTVTRNLDIGPYYNFSYPRAFHSVMYFFGKVTAIESNYLVLPFTLFSLSMLTFVVYDIWHRYRLGSKILLGLLTVVGVSSFLVNVTSYALFVPQIAVIPLLYTTLLAINAFSLTREGRFGLASIAILVLAVFNVYGIFPISLVLMAIAWRIYLAIKHNKGQLRLMFNRLRKYADRSSGLIVGAILVLGLPALVLTKNILVTQFTHTGDVDLLGSWGNLPGGFLSVFHMTGIWPFDLEYRGNPVGAHAFFGYIGMAIICIQVLLLVKGKLNRLLLTTLIQLELPVWAFLFILANPYIHFKYLTFFVPFLLICVALALVNFLKVKREFVAYGIIVLFLLYGGWQSIRYYRQFPVIQDFQLQELKALNETYIKSHRTLILTEEDWLQFYRRQQDDFVPNTIYRFRLYDNSKVDYVIWDKGYEKSNQKFLLKYPALARQLIELPEKCVTTPMARYVVYDMRCK